MNVAAESPRSPFGAGGFSPLNVAAYVTWLAILLQSLDWSEVRTGEARTWLGLASMLGMLAGYLASRLSFAQKRLVRQRSLVLWEAACVLIAIASLRNTGPAVLMIIVAAQVVALWPRRTALALLALINLAMLALFAGRYGWLQAVLILLPIAGFQIFAGLTIHYAMRAGQAHEELARSHEELARTHAELLATQQLLQDSARNEERLRLSRELHDVAGHKLTALRLNLRLLARDESLRSREELTSCGTLADELLAEIRSVVSELRRHDGLDLRAALQRLAPPITGTRIDIEVDPALRVMRVEQAETLLRCAQEGITNALRHGRARRIALCCRSERGEITLTVRNDGATANEFVFGNGLTGMRERLELLGGTLKLQALSEGGAELSARIPGAI